MRTLSLLQLVAVALFWATSAKAALISATSEPAISLKLRTAPKAPPAKNNSRTGVRKQAAPKSGQGKVAPAVLPVPLPPPLLPEPRAIVSPPRAHIVPNGILSASGLVQPIGTSGAPITPNGIISIPSASPVIHLQPVNPATREAEAAQIELAQFLFYDYPIQLRQMDSQIAVTQAEIVALQQRLANYSQFDKFINNANPLFESQQRASVALVDALQRLSNLEYQRGRLQQWLPVELRRRQLELHRALSPTGNRNR